MLILCAALFGGVMLTNALRLPVVIVPGFLLVAIAAYVYIVLRV